MTPVETQPRSVSQTQQYEECGWRYKLRRIDRVVPLPAAWSHHGTAFHATAEAVERSGRAMGTEEAVQLFSDQYAALINEALDQEPDTDRWLSASGSGANDIERRYVLGQEHTARYVEWTNEAQPKIWTTPGKQMAPGLAVDEGSDPEPEPALELYFMAELGGVKVRGYIDQLVAEDDGSVRVRDLKTGSMKSKFQLHTYKLAVEQLYRVPVNRGDWYTGKAGGLTRPLDLTEVTEAEVGSRYAEMDAGVKAGNFVPNPGYGCNFCDVKHRCSFSTART